MKPEVRVKLLKEYETIKTKSEPGSIWWNIITIIAFITFAVSSLIKLPSIKNELTIEVRSFLISVFILGTIWQTIIIVRKIYDKKILMLLQAVLDLSEEKISNEINKLDLELPEKEK